MKAIQYLAKIKPIGHGHGIPPVDFVTQLRAVILNLPDALFDKNPATHDIYAVLSLTLGPFQSVAERRAIMAAVLTVLPGDEADWKWNTGADTTAGAETPDETEAGPFQVSYNSCRLSSDLLIYLTQQDILTAADFQVAMKTNRTVSITYAVKALRATTAWDGPANRGWIAEQVTPELVALWFIALTLPV